MPCGILMDLITFHQCLDKEKIECDEQDVEDTLKTAEKVPKKSAFSLVISRKRTFIDEKKGTNLNRKDELFNDLVKFFKTSPVDFSSPTVSSDGSYCLQVLTNAPWYIKNDHLTIIEASKQAKEVTPIPKLFEGYVGYNEIKKNKVKAMSLSTDLLQLHSQALYYLLLKPYRKSTGSWKTISAGIQDLADCLNNYREYLNQKKVRPGCERVWFGCSCCCKRRCFIL